MNKLFVYLFAFVFLFSFTSAVAVSDGLVAHYKSNTQNFTASNQTTVLDSTGVNTGTFVGKTFNNGAVIGSGNVTISNSAMNFLGLADGSINCSTSLNSGLSNSLTLSLWVKPTLSNYNTDYTLIQNSKGNNLAVNNIGFWLSILNSTKTYRIGFGNGTNREYESGFVIDYSDYTNLIVTFNNGNVSFYKNGIYNMSSTWSLGSAINLAGVERLYISDTTNEFNGSINNVQIYNRSLSSSEIAGLYALGKDEYTNVSDGLVAQYSGRDYAGTSSAPTTIYDTNQLVQGKVNQGFGFDGVNDYVGVNSFSNVNFSNNVTISLWIKKNSNKAWSRVLSLGIDSNNEANILQDGNNFSRFIFTMTASGTADSRRVYGSGLSNLNEWFNLIIVTSPNNNEFYVNTLNVSTLKINNNNSFIANKLTIGSLLAGNGNFNGSIDDVRIYNRSLSSAEISALYNQGFGTEEAIYAANSTYVTILANNSNSTWNEGANITFTSEAPTSNLFSWLVDSVAILVGIGENVFNYVFDNLSGNPSSTVTLNTYNGTTSSCYQETATTSTACGGLDTGNYSVGGTNAYRAYDENWGTFFFVDGAYMYVNYTVPTFASTTSKWQVKDYTATINLSINSCINNGKVQFKAQVAGIYVVWSCLNQTGIWQTLRNTTDAARSVYEEAMYWDIHNNLENSQSWNITTTSANPNIQITYPVNGTTYTTDALNEFNYTFSDETASTCYYSLNGGANTSVNCTSDNITALTYLVGANTITLYAEDSVGNTNYSISAFTWVKTAYNSSNVIYQCGDIVSEGSYTLNQSISDDSCLNVYVSNVIIDGGNNNISITDYAILNNYSDNITIKNINFICGGAACSNIISFEGDTNNSKIYNNTFDITLSVGATGILAAEKFDNGNISNNYFVGGETSINISGGENIYVEENYLNIISFQPTPDNGTIILKNNNMQTGFYFSSESSATIIYDNIYGNISWSKSGEWDAEGLNFSWNGGTSGNIQIGNNTAYVDSTELPELNIPANITLNKGVTTFTLPSVTRDGVKCTDCTPYTANLNDAIVYFGVTGFSNYTIGDTPSIVLNYPTAMVNYGYLNGSLQLNITATDTNLASVWYQYPSISSIYTLDRAWNSFYSYSTNTTSGVPANMDIAYSSSFGTLNLLKASSKSITPLTNYAGCEFSQSAGISLSLKSNGSDLSNDGKYFCIADRFGNWWLNKFNATTTHLNIYNLTRVLSCSSGVPCLENISLNGKSIKIYANDTAGNTNSSVFSWDYIVFENNRTYVPSTFAKVSNSFGLNVTATNISNIKLNYNGINYSTNIYASGNNTISSVSVAAPLITQDTNVSFYWIVTLTDGSVILTNTNNQLVKYLIIGNNYSNLIYNITVRDEFTNALIPNNNVTMAYTVSYGYDNNSVIGTVAFNDQNYTNKNISSNINTSLYMSGSIIYSTFGYIGRTYTFSESNISSPKNVTIYLSPTNSSYVKTILVTDEAGRGKASLFRQYTNIGGIQTLVSSEQLDSTGKSTIVFTPNIQYTFTFTTTGCQDLTKNIIFYDQSDYTQVLTCSSYDPDDYVDPFEDMRVSFYPDGIFYVDNSTNLSNSLFSVNVSGNSAFCSNVNVLSFTVYNQLGIVIVNDNSNTCDVLSGSGYFNGFANGKLEVLLDSGESKTLNYRWIKEYSNADYSNYSILTLISEVGNSDDILGIDWKVKLFFCFIGLFGVIISLTYYQRLFNFSNLAMLIVIDVYLWVMSFIGWGDINIGATGGGITTLISKYALFILGIVASVGIMAVKEDEYS